MNELEQHAVELHRKLWAGNDDHHLRAKDTGEKKKNGKAVFEYETAAGTYSDDDVLRHLRADGRGLRVPGWSKYILGVDLAQANDNTALIGIHDRCLPAHLHGDPELAERITAFLG